MSLLLLFDDDEDSVTDGFKRRLAHRYNELFYKKYLKKTKKPKRAKKRELKPEKIVEPPKKEEIKPATIEQFYFYEEQFAEVLQGLALISELEAAKNRAIAMRLLDLERKRDVLWLEILKLKRQLDDEWIIAIAVATN